MVKTTIEKLNLLLLLALCLGYSSTLYTAQHDVDDEKEQSADNKLKQQEIRIIKRLNAQKPSFIGKPFQLPKKGDHFTGRKKEQASIVAFFGAKRNNPCAFQAITGIGGTGKTYLALHYAHASANGAKWVPQPYDAILWLYAEKGLDSQFHETAKVLGKKDCKTTEEAVAFVYQALQKKNRTLLVLDNAEQSLSIADYLPPKDQKGLLDILITTRNPHLYFDHHGEPTYITLYAFTREESRAYTQKVLGHKQHSQQDMDALCDSVRDLPVALSYALQYIKAEKYTLAKYPAYFVEHQLRLGTQMQASPLVTSFLLPVLTLKEKHPIIESLLVTAAHLVPKRIPITAVSTAADKAKTQQALSTLQQYGLLTPTKDYATFDIHRLVQQVFREWHLVQSGPTGVHTLLKDWMTDFQPLLEKGRPGGSSTDIQYFREVKSGGLWIGKCNINAFVGANNDEEYREALGLAIYRFFGIITPDFALSVQPVAPSVKSMLPHGTPVPVGDNTYYVDVNRPCIHIMTQFLDGFSTCEDAFAEDEHKDEEKENQKAPAVTDNDSPFMCAYKQAAKAKQPFYLPHNGKKYPLKGLGTMLALANFIYDMDCIGKSGGNLGYLIKGNNAQVVKIDPGMAFSFLENHTNKKFHHNPMDKKTFFANDERATLGYHQLTPVDQQAFAAMAKRILQTPRKTLKQLIDGVVVPGGWQKEMADKLLDKLISRKDLFLAAFALEIDDNLREEITDAKNRLVGTLVRQKDHQKQSKEQIAAYQKALKELREWEAKVAAKRLIKQNEYPNNQAQKPSSVKEPFQLPNNARGDLFTGRQQERASMAAFFGTKRKKACAFQAITGVGGLGKTYLALHYAHACADKAQWIPQRYDTILWLYAEAGLESQFYELAQAWGKKDCKTTEEAVEFVYMALQKKTRTLLVFDNVEQSQAVAPYLPPKHQKGILDILITTRNPSLDLPHYGKPTYITLAAFTKEEGRLYIQKVLGHKGHSQQAMDSLCETVSGLPLALNHALQYIAKGKCTLKKYPARFAEHQLRLGAQLQASPVVTSVLLSVLTLREAHPLIDPLLVTAAYLAPEKAPTAAVFTLLDAAKQAKQQALAVLHTYGLLTLAKDGQTFDFHRLVQQVLREWHRSKKGKEGHEALLKDWMAYFKEKLKYDDRDLNAIYRISPLIPHAYAIADADSSTTAIEKAQGNLYFQIGSHQYSGVAHYDRAARSYEKALKIQEKHYGADHPNAAITMSYLGAAHRYLGGYALAKEYVEQALKIQTQHYGTDHPDTALTMKYLGIVLYDLGDYTEAKQCYQKALKIFEKHYGADHPETAKMINNLGIVLADLGDYAQARKYYEKALKIKTQHYGAAHPQTAIPMINLGRVLKDQGDYALAAAYLKKALKINEKHYGADHPEIAITMHNLGDVLCKLGDYVKANTYYQKALKINAQHYGADHPQTARTMSSLGGVLIELGDYAEAKQCYQKVLKIQEKHYGDNHPQTASTMGNLGTLLRELGDYASAKKYLEKALKIHEKHYGADHPQTAIPMVNLGTGLDDLGAYAEAKTHLEKALKIFEQHYGATHPNTAIAMVYMGKVLRNLGQYQAAKQHFEKALKIQRIHYGADHNETTRAMRNLGHVLINLGDYVSSKKYLAHTLKIQAPHYGDNHPETANTMGTLGLLFHNLGQYDKAREYFQKNIKVFTKHYGTNHSETKRVKRLLATLKEDLIDGEKDADADNSYTLFDHEDISLDVLAHHLKNTPTFAAWLQYMHYNACDTDILLYTLQDKIDDNILYDGFKGDKNILLEVTNLIAKKEKTKAEAKKTKKHAESTLDNPLNQVTGKPNTPYKVHKQPKDASGPDKKENDTEGNKEIASSKQPLMWGQIDQLHHQLQPNEEKEDENQDDDVFDID